VNDNMFTLDMNCLDWWPSRAGSPMRRWQQWQRASARAVQGQDARGQTDRAGLRARQVDGYLEGLLATTDDRADVTVGASCSLPFPIASSGYCRCCCYCCHGYCQCASYRNFFYPFFFFFFFFFFFNVVVSFVKNVDYQPWRSSAIVAHDS